LSGTHFASSRNGQAHNMGLYSVVFLITVAILQSATSFAAVPSNALAVDYSPNGNERGALITRLLRSNNGVDNGEERLVWWEQLTKVLKRDDVMVKRLLENGETPHQALVSLGLNKGAGNLISDAKFGRWFKAVAKTNKDNWDIVMLAALRQDRTEAELASLILAAKKGRNKRIAKKLEEAQFKKWLHDGYWPSDVIEKVYKLGPGTWTRTDAKPVREAYKKYFRKMRPGLLT
ncbi:hypothetical protein L914_11391, partial [Phytophthora nicotianae]